MDKNLVNEDYVRQTAWKRWGVEAKRIGREYHSACYACGGNDRFIVFENGGYWCRVCGVKGWLDDMDKQNKPDAALLLKWQADNEQREQRRQIEIAERIAQFKTEVERDAYIVGRNDEREFIAREYFNAQGITDNLIEHYGLGYVAKHAVKTQNGIEYFAAYTIPVRDPRTWDVVNMQYRLADPVPAGVGKYRQETGLPTSAFYTKPDCNPDYTERPFDAVIVEGAKKAIVLDAFADSPELQVIGLPGCASSEKINEQIKSQGRKRLWVWLDPDAVDAARKLAAKLCAVGIVRTPLKPDDMVLAGMTRHELRNHLRLAV